MPFRSRSKKSMPDAMWTELPAGTFVILDENDQVKGSYYIKPNQGGRGSHVCNCGYVVAES